MRVYEVRKARNSMHDRCCHACGKKIQRGDSYRYIKPKIGPMKYFCHDDYPRPSDLTASKLGELYDAIEDAKRELGKASIVGDVEAVLENLIPIAELIRDAYQESIDNIPEQFQSGPIAESSQEKIDALEEYISYLELTRDSGEEDFETAKTAAEGAIENLNV